MDIKLYKFEGHGDDRGTLVSLEENKNIPFDIKRVYYMYDTTEGTVRGHHAHKKLEQILIATSGSCMIHLDNGYETAEVPLENPLTGLYISNNTWREMYNFSSDCVLMVLASELYDTSDYIRDYDEFLEYVKSQQTE